jgi:hypothetical protein
LSSRSETKFLNYHRFDEALEDIGSPANLRIADHMLRFQRAWQQSRTDNELNGSFKFKQYDVDGPYRLCQIYVGPNSDYRAAVMFPQGRPAAYWIYVFKKQRGNDRAQVKRAKLFAIDCWNMIKGVQDG